MSDRTLSMLSTNGMFPQETMAAIFRSLIMDLRGCALKSCCKYNEMTPEEVKYFQDVVQSNDPNLSKIFLCIRNRILYYWISNSKEQLLFERVLDRLEVDYDADKALAHRIYLYLERYGFINYGHFNITKPLVMETFRTAVVIGAGIAGLMAANQLKYLGFKVIVLEARDCVGGRMSTYRSDAHHVELGALTINDPMSNPLSILAHQNVIEFDELLLNIGLFDNSGKMITGGENTYKSLRFNLWYQLLFNMHDVLDDLSTNNDIPPSNMTVAEALDFMFKFRKLNFELQCLSHNNEILDKKKQLVDKHNQLKTILKEMADLRQVQQETFDCRIEGRQTCDENGHVALEFEQSQINSKINNLDIEYRNTRKETDELQAALDYLLKNMRKFNDADEYLVYFVALFLILELGMDLNQETLKNFCKRSVRDFAATPYILRKGSSFMPLNLTKGLTVIRNTIVKEIRYNSTGVEILAKNTRDLTENITVADVVLCTLPLGVLKRSLVIAPSDDNGVVCFKPPLPDWKTDAINRMGIKLTNHVVMYFESKFWDPNINVFASTKHIINSDVLAFWCYHKSPILVTSISGQHSWLKENYSDKEIVDLLHNTLKDIFGGDVVPYPKNAIITRWGSDPFSGSAVSCPTKDTMPNDYDILGDPITSDNCNSSTQQYRLFFAGEHTSRDYAATVHGAFVSGLRAAGRIYDSFLGIY